MRRKRIFFYHHLLFFKSCTKICLFLRQTFHLMQSIARIKIRALNAHRFAVYFWFEHVFIAKATSLGKNNSLIFWFLDFNTLFLFLCVCRMWSEWRPFLKRLMKGRRRRGKKPSHSWHDQVNRRFKIRYVMPLKCGLRMASYRRNRLPFGIIANCRDWIMKNMFNCIIQGKREKEKNNL